MATRKNPAASTGARPDQKPAPLATLPAAALAPLEASDWASDAGAGMEGADRDSFAIPFLRVLQKGSPQVDEASGVALEGARAGMLIDSVTNRLFDGKEGVVIVPCAYRRVFVRWGPRSGEGAGFKGELTPEAVTAMLDRGEAVEHDGRIRVPGPDGKVSEKTSDRISDTRNHYVLVVDPATGVPTQAVLSLASTQIKKSKALMSMLASRKVALRPGLQPLVTPPTFANLIRLTTVAEANDEGTWHGVRFEMLEAMADKDAYAVAKAFHATVAAGQVKVAYEDPAADPSAASAARSGF